MLTRCFPHAFPQVSAELVRGFFQAAGLRLKSIKQGLITSNPRSAHFAILQAGVSGS